MVYTQRKEYRGGSRSPNPPGELQSALEGRKPRKRIRGACNTKKRGYRWQVRGPSVRQLETVQVAVIGTIYIAVTREGAEP